MTKAVVTDGTQPAGQHMAQVTPDKFMAWHGGRFLAVGAVAIFPSESNGVGVEIPQAGITDDGAGDVGGQVFESRDAIAHRPNVHAPILVPHRGVDLPTLLAQPLAQMLAKGGLQMGQVKQAVGFLDAHPAAAPIAGSKCGARR